MKKISLIKVRSLIVLIFILCSHNISAQQIDSSKSKLENRNVIKINLSSFILYNPNFILSFERVLSPNKSFSIEAGYVNFPQLIGSFSDNFVVKDEVNRSGFKIDADFRFYLIKENKYTAPHGIYVGPYAAYYYFKNERILTALDTSIATGNLDLIATIQSPQLGAELGYQFSFLKDHMTVDLVLIGPALSLYKAKLKMEGDFDVNEENIYLQDILNALIANFPLLGNFVKEKQISSSGVANLFSFGYRYSVSVGYRF